MEITLMMDYVGFLIPLRQSTPVTNNHTRFECSFPGRPIVPVFKFQFSLKFSILNGTDLLTDNKGEYYSIELDNRKFAENLKITLETSGEDVGSSEKGEEVRTFGEEYRENALETSGKDFINSLETSGELVNFYESILKCYLRRTNASEIIADLFLGYNFPTRFECNLTSFPLVWSVNLHLFHSFGV